MPQQRSPSLSPNAPAARLKSPRLSSYLYFVRAEALGLIKIGIADQPLSRLCSLQVGSPDKLRLLIAIPTATAREWEKDYHRRFVTARSHGEWFRPNEELLAEIRDHQKRAETDSAYIKGCPLPGDPPTARPPGAPALALVRRAA